MAEENLVCAGLDLSLNKAGVAITTEKQLLLWEVFYPDVNQDWETRAHYLVDAVLQVLVRHGVNVVVLEGLSLGPGRTVGLKLALVSGMMRQAVHSYPGLSMKMFIAHPLRLKVFAAGKTKVPKEEMVVIATKDCLSRYQQGMSGDCKNPERCGDMADAYLLSKLARTISLPEKDWPIYHMALLNRIVNREGFS